MARYATGKYSVFHCQRCGWRYPYEDQQQEHATWRGGKTLIVCPTCWDPVHPQLAPRRKPADAQALRTPRHDIDDQGPTVPWTIDMSRPNRNS